MDRAHLTTVLQEYGLSPYQADAYVTLLELGSVAAQELADASEVPDQRIYDVLEALEAEGFVVTYEQDRLYAAAVDPEDALDGIRSRVRDLESAIEEITDRWQRPAPERRAVSLVQQADTVFEGAKGEIERAIDCVSLLVRPAHLEALRPTLIAARDRDVFVDLVVYAVDDEATAETLDVAPICTEAHVLYRPLRSMPFVALIDDRRARLSWHPDSDDEYGLAIEDSAHEKLVWHFVANMREAATRLYRESPYDPPLRFSSLRDCLRVVGPLVRAGDSLEASIEGRWTDTGRECRLSGRIASITWDPSDVPIQLCSETSLVLETDRDQHTVGDFDAIVEDVEATRIVITAIE